MVILNCSIELTDAEINGFSVDTATKDIVIRIDDADFYEVVTGYSPSIILYNDIVPLVEDLNNHCKGEDELIDYLEGNTDLNDEIDVDAYSELTISITGATAVIGEEESKRLIKYMRKEADVLEAYCKKQGWTIESVNLFNV